MLSADLFSKINLRYGPLRNYRSEKKRSGKLHNKNHITFAVLSFSVNFARAVITTKIYYHLRFSRNNGYSSVRCVAQIQGAEQPVWQRLRRRIVSKTGGICSINRLLFDELPTNRLLEPLSLLNKRKDSSE